MSTTPASPTASAPPPCEASPPAPDATTDPAAVVVTAADLAAYRKTKDEVAEMIKKEGASFFMSKGPATGLVNQGATCYMNSLLQSLFMTTEFRTRLYEWSYGGEEKDGAEEECIPLQLQRLFARLQESARAAVSTKSLTQSFGWTAAHSFRQHDVQELCRVLFDALEDATPGYSIVEEMFKGELVDYLTCQECGFERTRTDAFLDLDLTVKGSKSVDESLRAFVTPEVLAGDNQWFCEQCDKKVDAKKGLGIQAVPDVLTLHLKRFVFNFELMRRIKLHDPLDIPLEVDMSPYLHKPEPAGTVVYDLYSVMVHNGTAMGGHYFAYVKPPGTEAWMEFNDAVVKDLGEDGVKIVTGEFEKEAAEKEKKEAEAEAEPGAGEGEGEGADQKTDDVDVDGAGGKTVEGEEKKEEAGDSSTVASSAEPLEEKPGAEAGETKPAADAGAPTTAPGPDDVPPPSSDKIARSQSDASKPTGKAAGTKGNAYMLLYRRRGTPFDHTAVPPLPQSAKSIVDVENAAFQRVADAFAVKQKVVELEIHLDPAVVSAEASSEPSTPTPEEAGGNGDEGGVGAGAGIGAGAGAGAGDGDGDGDDAGADTTTDGGGGIVKPTRRVVCLDILKSATLRSAIDQAYDSMFTAEEKTRYARDNVRLREFVPSCRRATTTYTGKDDDTLQACGLAPARTMMLEVREPGADWQEYNPDEMVVRVVRYDSALVDLSDASLADLQAPEHLCAVVAVEGDQEATVGSLQAAIACSALGIPTVMQRVIKLRRDGTAAVLTDMDKLIKKDYGVWSGEDVIVELISPGETVDSSSAVLEAFDAARNKVNVSFNDPSKDEPAPEYELSLEANLRESLAAVKTRICERLKVDPDDFHLKRNANPETPQLKDESETLRDLGLVEGSILHVGKGAPLSPDEFMLKVYRYDPAPKPHFTFLHQIPVPSGQRIGALKRRLSDGLAHPPANLRVRAKTGHEAGKIFRDNTTVLSNIKFLRDGSEFAVQLLDHPEKVSKDDMVLSVRCWRPTRASKKVTPNIEVVLSRRTVTGELRRIIRDRFLADAPVLPEPKPPAPADAEAADPGGAPTAATTTTATTTATPADDGSPTPSAGAGAGAGPGDVASGVPQDVGIAKFLSMDGVLTLTKLKALKWNDPTIEEDQVISSRPLGLRDGSMVVCRDEREYSHALAAGLLKGKKKADGGAGVKGRLGSRRSGFGRGSSSSRPAPREVGLSIRRRRTDKPSEGGGDAEAAGGEAAAADSGAEPPTAATATASGGPCESCGTIDSDVWNSTAVAGMTLCGGCAQMLGGS